MFCLVIFPLLYNLITNNLSLLNFQLQLGKHSISFSATNFSSPKQNLKISIRHYTTLIFDSLVHRITDKTPGFDKDNRKTTSVL